MNRLAQGLISPREILRQHRTGRTLCVAEQLRARKRGFRQAHEPKSFLDAVAAAFLPPPPVVGRGHNLAGAAIGERHRGGKLDLVTFLVVRNRSPVPAALVSDMCRSHPKGLVSVVGGAPVFGVVAGSSTPSTSTPDTPASN